MLAKKGNSFFPFVLCMLLIAGLFLTGCGTEKANENGNANEKDHIIRIGYQKNGPLLILKERGTLDKRLKELGYQVEWKEFQAGPALVEALNAGSIDFGRTGNTPPIFSQASGAPFVYVAAGKSKYEGSGILVPKDSSIKKLEDLKGKKIGFAKGSSSHYLLVKALEKAGLSYEEITPAFLQPGDARVAFEQGNIDAWVTWDPYTSSTELDTGARLLVDGKGLTTDRDFFLAHEQFANTHQDIIPVIIEEIRHSSDWANTHHEELTQLLAQTLKLDESSIKKAIERRVYGVDNIDQGIIDEQQEIADTFYKLKITPVELNVLDVMQTEEK
ncbi:MAG TPA: sulfonate ABC transporter substrate-binding protein [Chondromyces sp.]|nr:sulfonate ABC transporter substrate-binding protein [Chondromyces sp.]